MKSITRAIITVALLLIVAGWLLPQIGGGLGGYGLLVPWLIFALVMFGGLKAVLPELPIFFRIVLSAAVPLALVVLATVAVFGMRRR